MQEMDDAGSVPGSGRSSGGGHGNPRQYSRLENPWTEEPGGLQSIVSQRVRHNPSGLTLTLAEYTNRQSHVLDTGIYSDYNGELKKKLTLKPVEYGIGGECILRKKIGYT